MEHICAIVCAIADFPAPAGPYIHKTRVGRLELVTQAMISSTTATLVFSWHSGGSPRLAELCNAPVITCFWSSFKPKARDFQNRGGEFEYLRTFFSFGNCVIDNVVDSEMASINRGVCCVLQHDWVL